MESENNKSILDTIRAVRHLPQDTALILETTHDFMSELGWDGLRRSNQSTWLPGVRFSVYRNQLSPHIYIFISITVGDEKDVAKFSTPLISAGIIDYGTGNLAYDFGWDYVNAAHWNSGGKDDFGTLMKITMPTDAPEQFKAESVTFIYYPLVRITGSTELNSLILQSLKLMINNLGE